MKQYSYLLFDWDGCLTKTLELALDTYKKTFAEYGVYPDNKTIVDKVLGDWSGPKKLGIKDIDIFTKKLLSKISETYSSAGLYEGAMKTLTNLKRKGKKLALITTSPKAIVWPGIEYNNLENMFDVYLMADDVKNHKPDPEIINKSIEKLEGDKNQSIIIGDSKSDLGAAINAGIDSILFYPKEHKKIYDLSMLKRYNPTFIVNNFEDILKIVT